LSQKPRFLLDEHISGIVVKVLSDAGIDARRVSGSKLAGREDDEILNACISENRILVTYDRVDFELLLREAVEERRSIPGMIFANTKSWPTAKPGLLAARLVTLAAEIEQGTKSVIYGLILGAST
jgi:predicted nuclease of predicted toxin-antitoxin system